LPVQPTKAPQVDITADGDGLVGHASALLLVALPTGSG
jgi:hypothetical protein